MKPVSISAFSIILEDYLDQMIKEGPTCCSSATISAVSVVWDHTCPDDDDLDEEGIIEFFDFLEDIYKWMSTQKGLKDYLKVRFEEEEEPEGPYFFIGTTEDCFYKNIDDLKGTQKVFNHRAKMNTLAAQGKWSKDLEI